jgi:hypothetical protein
MPQLSGCPNGKATCEGQTEERSAELQLGQVDADSGSCWAVFSRLRYGHRYLDSLIGLCPALLTSWRFLSLQFYLIWSQTSTVLSGLAEAVLVSLYYNIYKPETFANIIRTKIST